VLFEPRKVASLSDAHRAGQPQPSRRPGVH
jgi:hypothetical protein